MNKYKANDFPTHQIADLSRYC